MVVMLVMGTSARIHCKVFVAENISSIFCVAKCAHKIHKQIRPDARDKKKPDQFIEFVQNILENIRIHF